MLVVVGLALAGPALADNAGDSAPFGGTAAAHAADDDATADDAVKLVLPPPGVGDDPAGDDDAAPATGADVAAARADDGDAAANPAAHAAPQVPPAPPPDPDALKPLPAPQSGLGDLVGPLLKTILMLCIVLGLVYLTLSKGLGKLVERQNLGRRVKVVERVGLDAKRSLFLVEVDGKQMLLAAGEGGVTLLKDVETKAAAAPPPSFMDALRRRDAKKTNDDEKATA